MKATYKGKTATIFKVSEYPVIWETRIYNEQGKDITNTQWDCHRGITLKYSKVRAKDLLGVHRNSPDWFTLKWSNN